jgi:pyruvate,water dikinase
VDRVDTRQRGGDDGMAGLVDCHNFALSCAHDDFRPILQRKLGTKEFKLVYEEGGTRQTRSVPVSTEDRERFVLSDDDVLTLARWAVLVERHYSELRHAPTPMDREWAKDGRTGELYLVQARPETVHKQRDAMVLERFHLDSRGELLAKGRSVGEKIGRGPSASFDRRRIWSSCNKGRCSSPR